MPQGCVAPYGHKQVAACSCRLCTAVLRAALNHQLCITLINGVYVNALTPRGEGGKYRSSLGGGGGRILYCQQAPGQRTLCQ